MEYNPFRTRGKSAIKTTRGQVKSVINTMLDELVSVGRAYASVDDGKLTGHSVTDVWLDDLPNVGSTGWHVPNKLNWATLLICHHFGIPRDEFFTPHLTTKPDRLFFTQAWGCLL